MGRIVKSTILFVMGILWIAACGGGSDSSWLFPLWVVTDVAVIDIDGDGRTDVVTLAQLSTSMSQHEGRLVVYRQTATGVFAAPESYAVGSYPWKLALGDVDGDGLPDILVTDPDGLAVWMLLQDSAHRGRFLAAQKVASGVHAYEAALADLNGDGAPDIAVAASRSGKMLLLYQDPSQRGTFLPAVDFTLPGNPANVTAGDLDGDGRLDLFSWIYLANTGYVPNGELVIALQQPAGEPGPVTSLAPQTGLNAADLAIVDYDGDGRNDLMAFFTPFSSDYKAKLTVLLQGVEPGTFTAPVDTSLAGISGVDGAVFADLNGDGLPDVAVVGAFPVGSPSTVKSRLNLFTHSAGGQLSLAAVYDMPIAITRVGAGDIDGDGREDLVVLGGNNQVLVLLQSHTAPGTFDAPYPLR